MMAGEQRSEDISVLPLVMDSTWTPRRVTYSETAEAGRRRPLGGGGDATRFWKKVWTAD